MTAFLAACQAPQAATTLEIPQVYGSHMVLQQAASVPLRGHAAPGAEVAVASSWGSAATTVASDSGAWVVYLATAAAGFDPQSVTVASGAEEIRFEDVLIGEVWLASGQSNMQMPLRQAAGGAAELDNAANAGIRLLNIAPRASLSPQADIASGWTVSSPETAAGFSAVAWYFASRLQALLGVPVGIVNASWGASTIDAWIDEATLSRFEFVELPNSLEVQAAQRLPATAFNAMINPIVGYPLRGVIWYQGEAQVQLPKDRYARLLPGFVGSWRGLWRDESLPFYFAQIAPFDYRVMGRSNLGAAAVREIQARFAEEAANTGMVVTLDVGDCADIHPRHKAPVGHRLANMALAEAYGEPSGAYRSAGVLRVEQAGRSLRIVFAGRDGPMSGKLSGFELAASAEGPFVPAAARLEGNSEIVVSAGNVAEPARVRYAAGADCPVAGLFDGQGLPVGPFDLPAPYPPAAGP